ncbi:MAG: hypothetical protein ACJ75B_13175 [Flavisolibacter sp.]|jgi:hypothetical protein
MGATIKWTILSVVCAFITFLMYRAIDSPWSVANNASILITIGFFLAAAGTILCVFNAVEAPDSKAEKK